MPSHPSIFAPCPMLEEMGDPWEGIPTIQAGNPIEYYRTLDVVYLEPWSSKDFVRIPVGEKIQVEFRSKISLLRVWWNRKSCRITRKDLRDLTREGYLQHIKVVTAACQPTFSLLASTTPLNFSDFSSAFLE